MRIAKVVALAVAVHASAAFGDDVFLSVDEAKALEGKEGVRFVFSDAEKDYAQGHIPGSVVAYAHDMQYLDDVRKCKGLPMCEPTAAAFIGKLGIDADTEVVAYDGGAGVNASGVWFFLRLYGHPKVKILDGGLASWKAKGLPVDKEVPKVAPKSFRPTVQWSMIAAKDEVLAATQDPSKYLLLDSRHILDQYTGKALQEGLTSPGKEVTVARGGFIPQGVFSPWTKYAGNKNGEANKPTLKPEEQLKKQLQKLKKNGYAPEKTVITYCHVGLGRSTFQYLALQRAGHQDVKLYVGSWNEWGNTPELPLGTVAGE